MKQELHPMADKHYDWTTHQADMRPNKIAIVDLDTGREISYSQLEERSIQLHPRTGIR